MIQPSKYACAINTLVVNHPVFKYYDCNEKVTLQCDACERRLGAASERLTGQKSCTKHQTLTQTLTPTKKYNRFRIACHCFNQYTFHSETR